MARGRLALNKDRNKVERKEKAKTVKRRDMKGRKEGTGWESGREE